MRSHIVGRDIDLDAVAKALDVTPKTLNNYLNDEREPSLTNFAKLCGLLRLPPGKALGLELLDEDTSFTLVDVTDARASAGAGSVADDATVRNQIAFRTEWLRGVTSAPVESLQVLEADGDSMVPTIHSGDHLLVDKTQQVARRDGLYVIEWDGYLNVKRVTTNLADGTVSITSDNPSHRSYDGIKPDNLRVVGRVIWIGRRT